MNTIETTAPSNMLRNIAADQSKSGQRQGSSALAKFNEFLSTDYDHFSLPEDITYGNLRLTDFNTVDDGNDLEDMFGRFGHYLFSRCKLSWKTSDQYISAMKKQVIARFPTLSLLFNGFYKSLRHNLRAQYDERADTTLTDIVQHHEAMTKPLLRKVCARLYELKQYTIRCIICLDFHCIGRIKEIIKLPVSKLEVKTSAKTFMNCLMIILNRYKTSSKSCLHLLHECDSDNERNWYSDPIHCIADMLARGGNASKYLFPHFSNRNHYVDMVNKRLQSIFDELTDDDLDNCDMSGDILNEITSHGIRAAAIIHSDATTGISPHWTELRAGLSREKVSTISSYDRLTNPVDLRVARALLDWPDVDHGGFSPIFHQTLSLHDHDNFRRFVDALYTGIIQVPKLRIFLGIALLLDYEDVSSKYPGSLSHLKYAINLIGCDETHLLQWSREIKQRYYDINNEHFTIGHSTNVTQQQYNERIENKLEYLMHGQRQLKDGQKILIDEMKVIDANQSAAVTATRTIIESITLNTNKHDDLPPKKKQRQMLIAAIVSAGDRPIDIELNMKHVSVSATILDYYNKQYYQCIKSNNSTSKSTSDALKKMRMLITSLHYLAKDDVQVIAWCKTPVNQRTEDWSSRMLTKSLSLQDLAMQKLREYGIKVHNKGPVFWSTVKTFQEKGLLDEASNYYA